MLITKTTMKNNRVRHLKEGTYYDDIGTLTHKESTVKVITAFQNISKRLVKSHVLDER
jgi:hypothetical protein